MTLKTVMYNEYNLQGVVTEMGRMIREDYRDKVPVVIGVLTGGFMLLSDLVKELKSIQLEVDFMRISNYTNNQRDEKPKVLYDVKSDVKGRDVILVDDAMYTGETMSMLKKQLSIKGAKSVKIAVMFKNEECNVDADYFGFNLENGKFVVGYGSDNNKLDRNILDIYSL